MSDKPESTESHTGEFTPVEVPTVGRIVHYVGLGVHHSPRHQAAIITAAHDSGLVSLCVLNTSGVLFEHSIPFDQGFDGGTWHWPERG